MIPENLFDKYLFDHFSKKTPVNIFVITQIFHHEFWKKASFSSEKLPERYGIEKISDVNCSTSLFFH